MVSINRGMRVVMVVGLRGCSTRGAGFGRSSPAPRARLVRLGAGVRRRQIGEGGQEVEPVGADAVAQGRAGAGELALGVDDAGAEALVDAVALLEADGGQLDVDHVV